MAERFGSRNRNSCKRLFSGISFAIFSLTAQAATAQIQWVNVDSAFGPLPAGTHVFKTSGTYKDRPFVAGYAIFDLNNKDLKIGTDTVSKRRLTPNQFYVRLQNPLLVVNTAFFSYKTQEPLNVVVNDRKMLFPNVSTIPLGGKDTLTYRHVAYGTFLYHKPAGMNIGWSANDDRNFYFSDDVHRHYRDSAKIVKNTALFPKREADSATHTDGFHKSKPKLAIGGGPVLMSKGEIFITNNEEARFSSKAGQTELHPRTVIGYTSEGKLVVLIVQGRMKGIAEGASLQDCAAIMKDIGCYEALNLDGGGSSCMLINGKEVIIPSEKGEQRPVPTVLYIQKKD